MSKVVTENSGLRLYQVELCVITYISHGFSHGVNLAIVPSTQNQFRRSGKKGRSQGQHSGDRQIVADHHYSTSANLVPVPTGDVLAKPVRMELSQHPPKQIRNKIFWIQQTCVINSGISVSSSIDTEGGFGFTLSQLGDYTALTSIFDQYCIYSVLVAIQVNAAGLTNTAARYGRLTTALDFDNVLSLGSESANMQFSTARTTNLVANMAVQRYILPCVAPALYGGSTFSSYGIARSWCDSASTNTQHYGLRVYFSGNNASNVTYDVIGTFTLGFRSTF
jgi:hypothetical protein